MRARRNGCCGWEANCQPADEPLSSGDVEILFVNPSGVPPSVEAAELDLSILDPNGPAYIFFTSGTTGVPKAVLGCHKGLSHFLAWQRDTFNVGPGDRVAQLTNLSFDAVLRDVFLPLTSGAELCLPAGESPLFTGEHDGLATQGEN